MPTNCKYPWIVALFISISTLWSQNLPLEISYAFYRGDGERTRIQLSISVNRTDLDYYEDGRRLLTRYGIIALLKDKNAIIQHREWEVEEPVSHRNATQIGALVSQISIWALPDEYNLQVVMQDHRGWKFDSTLIIKVPRFPATTLSSSTLQANWNRFGPQNNATLQRNIKSGLVPNPGRRYSADDPMLWYDLTVTGIRPGDSVTVIRNIMHADTIIQRLRPKSYSAPGIRFKETAALNTALLNPGLYILGLDVIVGEATVQRQLTFTVEADRADSNKVDIVTWVSNAGRVKLLNDVNAANGRINTRLYRNAPLHIKEAMIRTGIANIGQQQDLDSLLYSEGFLERWRVIRGNPGLEQRKKMLSEEKVLLLYGYPDFVEVYPRSFSDKGYQIWSTSVSEDAFVFVERGVRGRYRLVHQVGNDEVSNPDWPELVNGAGLAAILALESRLALKIDTAAITSTVADTLSVDIDSVTTVIDTPSIVDSLTTTNIDSLSTIVIPGAAEPVGIDSSGLDSAAVADTTTTLENTLPVLLDSLTAPIIPDSLMAPVDTSRTSVPADSSGAIF